MINTRLLTDTLQSLGISRCYKGYRPLIISVELALADEERLMCVTEGIYKPAAEMCNCNGSNVERNIRTVINNIWKNNSDRLTDIAGYRLTAPPSASELISILVTYVERNSIDI